MLDLESPDWSEFGHAYGSAADVPGLLMKLRTHDEDEWEDANIELMSAILHQGDVYTATYAAAPHLVEIASDMGPCWQSDDLLCSVGAAARGTAAPYVPDVLSECWEDAQCDALGLIVDRLIDQQVSPKYAGLLIGAALFLHGEWEWGQLVSMWLTGGSLTAVCTDCSAQTPIFLMDGVPHTRPEKLRSVLRPVDVSPGSEEGIVPDYDFQFDEEHLALQVLGLATACVIADVEREFRLLLGRFACPECSGWIQITSAVGRLVD